MSEPLPRHPTPEVQEDLQEAAFAALRRVLEHVRDWIEAGRLVRWVFPAPPTPDEADLVARVDRLYTRVLEALAGEPGRTFVDHMRHLEAENAAFRGAVQALQYCGHGCATACPHTRLFRQVLDSLTLGGVRRLQSSALLGGPA